MPLGEQLARLSQTLADRYAIDRELGAGGMATVYLARDLRHERDVALKVLRPELTAILGADRFLNEIRITAQLDHPHILTLIDSGVADGLLWYVIPFVRGETLRQKLDREKQLALPEVARIAGQLAGALDYAHRRGVIHRDIKPENILFHEGEIVLADFGIALAVKEAGGPRLTETGLSLGTPQYMSPEQATGDRQLDARSDVYSLGAVVYEMVAGEPPHTGATVQAIVAKLITERPTRLTVVRDTTPELLDRAVAKALAKVPADRWETAGAFSAALGESIADRAPVATKAINWRPWVLGGVVVAGLAVAVWLGTRDAGSVLPIPQVAPDRVQLTFTGNARYPAISPDGKRLAYVGSDCGPDGCTSWLGIEDIGGGSTLKALAGATDLAVVNWTGDGRFVVVTRGNEEILAVSTLGGDVRTLAADARFGWPIPGTDTIVHGAGRTRYDRALFRTGADGRVVDSVALTGYGPVLPAPGGGLLLATDGGDATAVHRIVTRSGAITDSVVYPVAGTRMGTVEWLPNATGYLLAMPRLGDREWDIFHYRVDVTNKFAGPPDTVLRQLPLIPTWGWFDLTADGRTMVYGAINTETVIWALERRNVDSTQFTARRLLGATVDARAVVDSAGDRVAFRRQVTGTDRSGWQLFVIPFDSGQAMPVSPVLDQAPSFGWASGGGSLLYTRQAVGPVTEVVAVDVASRRETRIGAIAAAHAEIWPLPGGGAVAVAADGDQFRRFHLLGRPGRADTVISFPEPVALEVPKLLAPRPDGQALVIRWLDDSGRQTLSTVSLRDGGWAEVDRRNLLTWVTFVRWQGESIEYGRWEGWGAASWWRVAANGGSPRRLGSVPYVSRSTVIGESHSFSADGRRAVAVQTIDRSDAYMIRNLDKLLRR